MNKNFTILSKKKIFGLSKGFVLISAFALSFSGYGQSVHKDPFAEISGKENTLKRTQFSRHFTDESGNTTSVVTAGTSLNYKDASGAWEIIDLNITTNNTGRHPQHQWANVTNNFRSFYSSNISQGVITEYPVIGAVKEGLNKKMVWMDEDFNILNTIDINSGNAIKFENRVLFSNVVPNVDLVYYQQNDGRKMDYILNDISVVGNAPAQAKYLAFAENFELPSGSTASAVRNETGKIVNMNVSAQGNIIFRYELPKHYDSGNSRTESFYIVNQNTIYTVVEKSWLESGLSYPVFIDPTTTVYPTGINDYNTGCVDNQANDYPTADINVGYREAYGASAGTPRRFFRSWASFDVSAIPDDATINNVTFGCHILVNSLYFDPMLAVDAEEQQRVIVSPMTSVPNQLTGGDLYNAINQNTANGIFTVNPLPENITAPIDATLDITTLAVPSVTASLASNIYSLGFVPRGEYYTDYSDFVSIYGSTRATATTGGKPYLIITYTENMNTAGYSKSIGLYPNPVQSELFIKSDENISSVEVFSLLGQSVIKTTGKDSINVSSLSNGIYTVQVILENGIVINEKFVKN